MTDQNPGFPASDFPDVGNCKRQPLLSLPHIFSPSTREIRRLACGSCQRPGRTFAQACLRPASTDLHMQLGESAPTLPYTFDYTSTPYQRGTKTSPSQPSISHCNLAWQIALCIIA